MRSWTTAVLALTFAAAARAASVTVNCTATTADPPLSKSLLGVYQTPFWFKTHPPGSPDGRRMVAMLAEAGVHDLRYELAWGKPDVFAPDQVRDVDGRPTLDAAPLSPFLHDLAAAHVTPLLSLGYCPTPLQRGPPGWQRWKAEPADLSRWSDLCRQASDQWSFARPAFEVWNEPDLPGDGGKVFFAGGPAAYGRVYAATAAGVGRASVGGPATAYDPAYLTRSGILDQRIDFVSVHAYGNAATQLAAARTALAGRRLPLRLTEYASYPDAALPSSARGHAAAATLLADVRRLLAEPSLEKVYWAQWVDDSIGMVDEALHRRALFNAVVAYQTVLPTTRRPVSADGVEAMAAADGPAAGVAVWNPTDQDQPLTVELTHAGRRGRLRVFRIDPHHASHGDDPTTERLIAEASAYVGDARWSGTIPARSVVVARADADP